MGGKTPSTAAASQLAHLSTKTFFESDAARKTFFKQLTEAMTTGGVGARIPIIQRAVEAQSAAAGQAATLGREKTARAGLSGSPFDVATSLGRQAQSTSQIAGIGPQIAMDLMGAAPGAVTSGTGLPGLASAASIKANAAAQGTSTASSEIGAGAGALGTIGGAALASYLGGGAAAAGGTAAAGGAAAGGSSLLSALPALLALL